MSEPDYSTHEALHMSSFLMQAVESELMDHDAIKTNPARMELATAAFDALFELYQSIGADHLGAEFEPLTPPTPK